MDPLILKEIPAESTWPLRHAVLRPNQTLAEMDYPGDRDPETRHFGAFEGGTLVGIASLYREPSPLWRLRGMAVLPERRGRGVGARLLRACLDHARREAPTRLWCNARVGAVAFYERLGFRVVGDVFDLPPIGPHYRMEADLSGNTSNTPTAAEPGGAHRR